jgi:hypothetical protein
MKAVFNSVLVLILFISVVSFGKTTVACNGKNRCAATIEGWDAAHIYGDLGLPEVLVPQEHGIYSIKELTSNDKQFDLRCTGTPYSTTFSWVINHLTPGEYNPWSFVCVATLNVKNVLFDSFNQDEYKNGTATTLVHSILGGEAQKFAGVIQAPQLTKSEPTIINGVWHRGFVMSEGAEGFYLACDINGLDSDRCSVEVEDYTPSIGGRVRSLVTGEIIN